MPHPDFIIKRSTAPIYRTNDTLAALHAIHFCRITLLTQPPVHDTIMYTETIGLNNKKSVVLYE